LPRLDQGLPRRRRSPRRSRARNVSGSAAPTQWLCCGLFLPQARACRGVLWGAQMLTAYSYARFSSSVQAQGHSEARQLEDARIYAKEKGFALDESLGVDRGLSGYTGENLTRGVLGSFLAAVSSGKIKRGSVLIVENPDRLSRRRFAEV